MTALLDLGWVDVCDYGDLLPERGVRALVDGTAVAVFLLSDGSVHAIADVDPFSGASVLSRGIVGTRNDAPVVASPMFKQSFDLRTGVCVDDASMHVAVLPVRVAQGRVLVGST